ncbi:uncharacterized protein SETTUDRAFT_37618 [Exserohilum turcica Et28A]|uniref:Uncharacterized protein n=1 Tax=Exserohilum turcicum (strain 28A) TaxID=671987 RepID=R0IYZ4_EXST2|nr:uncharacterized protein SETTUDRAFT_37618 [Exserohilum turcica Et28A]EOA89975.1 hypothetical protein SETTUDRAFT_37618 [Exserohilum turcica Et28A]
MQFSIFALATILSSLTLAFPFHGDVEARDNTRAKAAFCQCFNPDGASNVTATVSVCADLHGHYKLVDKISPNCYKLGISSLEQFANGCIAEQGFGALANVPPQPTPTPKPGSH